MENGKLLAGHSDMEKGSYLGAIASIATADRTASEEEMEKLEQLADAAELSDEQKQAVITAATDMNGEELTRCLDVLKNSDLKYSLVTDLIAFAKSDNSYSGEEEQNIQKISQYLGVEQKQFSLLEQFTDKAATTEAAPEEMAQPNFLSSLGLKDKMQSAGINTGSLFKGLLGIAGPMILGGLVSGAFNRNRGGGMFGGSGGLGGMLGGGGGLGSLVGMLSGGRGFGNTGGLLGRVLGGRF
jgi:uncharacterized tellurite resistance protein B-like protein